MATEIDMKEIVRTLTAKGGPMTTAELAEECGVSPRTIQGYRARSGRPVGGSARKIIFALAQKHLKNVDLLSKKG